MKKKLKFQISHKQKTKNLLTKKTVILTRLSKK